MLTSYEGMIDKHSATAFNASDQELEFNSFAFTKPIVLQKTHAISEQIASTGVTTTSKNYPRRTTAELKNRKMEGLVRYSLSYRLIIHHTIYALKILPVSCLRRLG